MTSSIIDIMTAGLIAVREEFYSEVGIEKLFVAIGTMNLAVAEDAVEFGSQSTVLHTMSRRNRMTLPAEPVSRLDQKSVIGRTVRLVAFGTTAAVDQMLVGDRMLISERPGFFRMTILTGPIQSDSKGRVIHALQLMAIGAANVPGLERMNGAPFEFGRDGGMAGGAEIFAVIFDQTTAFVTVNSVARKTGNIRPIVRVGGDHSRLMRIGMAAAADFRLSDQ